MTLQDNRVKKLLYLLVWVGGVILYLVLQETEVIHDELYVNAPVALVVAMLVATVVGRRFWGREGVAGTWGLLGFVLAVVALLLLLVIPEVRTFFIAFWYLPVLTLILGALLVGNAYRIVLRGRPSRFSGKPSFYLPNTTFIIGMEALVVGVWYLLAYLV